MESQLDRNHLLRRLKRLSAAWTWDLGALIFVTGKTSDEAQEQKTAAMHQWLLGLEFPETVVALLKSGRVVFIASSRKSEFLQKFAGPEVSILTRTGSGLEPPQLAEFESLLRQGSAEVTVGLLRKEKHVGPIAEAMVKAIDELPSLKVVESREVVSELLAPKDEEELGLTRKAATSVSLLTKSEFFPIIESCLDQELQRTNQDICAEFEKLMDDEARITKWGEKHGLEAPELDLFYVSLQSGATFDLKPAVEPNGINIPMTGTYLLSMGLKYSEYSACVSRTLMVDPTPNQKDIYSLALKIQAQVVAALVPGVVLKDVYLAAMATVVKTRPDLQESFAKHVGFGMGLEFRDTQLIINSTAEQKVVPGMVFCVSVGFTDCQALPKAAVWLSDTVIVPVGGGVAELLTGECSSAAADVMFEVDPEDAPLAAPAQTPPSLQAGAAQGKAKSPARPEVKKAAPKQAAPKKPAAKKGAQAAPAASAAPQAPKADRPSRGKPPAPAAVKSPAKTRSERTVRSSLDNIDLRGTKLKETRTRKKNEQTKQDNSELQRFEDEQVALRKEKLKEIEARFGGREATSNGDVQSGSSRLADCAAYASPATMPRDLRDKRLRVDLDAEAVLVPMFGTVVPFHVRTIKNMSRNASDRMQFLRVNFFTPGQGKTVDDFPTLNGNRLFVKELCFKSHTPDNLDAVVRGFKEAQKRAKQKELEAETRRPATQAGPLMLMRTPHCLRDVNVRPSVTAGGRRCVGTLEAHSNGFRFSTRGGADKVDILYSQVKHAIFEPCEGAHLVILHLHLHDPMMVGKKKLQDIQFFAEAVQSTEDLSLARGGHHYDPDEILEEQREREMRERLNKIFQDYTKKVESIEGCPLEFDIPFKELGFSGVPNKSIMNLCPCSRVLCGLQDWPPFLLDLSEVEIAVFERATMQLREFDVTFVKKDYDQSPVRITTIPTSTLGTIKRWLHEMKVVWYSVHMNMQWPMVMKEIAKDMRAFVEDGGWDHWFGQQEDDEDEDEEGGANNTDDDDWDDDGDDESEDAGDDGSDFDMEDDVAGDDSGGQSDEGSDGMSWDELEREAERSDRTRALEERAQALSRAPRPTSAAPPSKRPRRR